MKKKSLLVLLAAALLIVPLVGNAATLNIVGQSTALPGESFFIDVFLTSMDAPTTLDDIYAFSFSLGIAGPGNATFEESGETPPFFTSNDYTTGLSNYIFFGNSGDWEMFTPAPQDGLDYQITVVDNAATAVISPPSDANGALLGRLLLDVDLAASFGEVYTLSLVGAANELFDSSIVTTPPGNPSELMSLPDAYSFQVVPIPAAAWLLGAGLLGLIGLRRKSS